MEAVEWLAPFKRYTERLREHVEHRTLEETLAYAAQETNLSWDTGSSSKPPSLNDGGADLFKRVTFDQVLKSVESSRER